MRTRKRFIVALVYAVLIAIIVTTCGACSYVRPLAQYEHVSQAVQHLDGEPGNQSIDMFGVGVRIRPTNKVQIDLLENYTLQEFIGGKHESFTGRVTVEF
jgi:hypothetical protein